MKRSTDRIITSQVGSLPRPNDLRKLWDDRLAQRPSFDRAAYDARVKSAVAEMVQQQAACGIDVVSDGEQGRLGWTAFLPERLAGFEERPVTGPGGGGVTGFIALFTRIPPTPRRDEDATTALAVFAVGGCVVTLIGALIGWVTVGRRQAS